MYFVVNLMTGKVQGNCESEKEAREQAEVCTKSTGEAHAVLKRIAYTYVHRTQWIEG